MRHLFCYGSLMFVPVWSRVVHGHYDRIEGTLCGYQRRGVRGATYPCIIPANDEDCIQGVIYINVCAADIRRLDAFEGALYDRQTAVCVGTNHKRYHAEVYVIKMRYRARVADEAWDADWFASQGLAQFLSQYGGFHEAE